MIARRIAFYNELKLKKKYRIAFLLYRLLTGARPAAECALEFSYLNSQD